MPNNYCGGGIEHWHLRNVRVPPLLDSIFGTNKNSHIYSNTLLDTLPIAQIACGSNHCIVLTERNELYYQASSSSSLCGSRSCHSTMVNDHDHSQHATTSTTTHETLNGIYTSSDRTDAMVHKDFRKLNFGKKIRMVAASSDQVFVISKDDEIFTFGGKDNSNTATAHSSLSNSVQFQLFKPWQQIGERIDKFVASCFTSCFIIVSTEGKIYVSGSQHSFNYGMLGISTGGNSDSHRRFHRVTLPGNERSKIKIVAMGGQHTIIVTERNEFYCSGSNIHYQLGFQSSSGKQTNFVKPKNIPFIGKRIESVSCGYDFTFVLVEGNVLYACGNSSSGQISGTFERINFFTRIPFSFPIRQVACGEDFTMIQTNNGLFYRTGSNRHSQLFLKQVITRNGSRSEVDKISTFEPCYIDDNIDEVVCGSSYFFMYKKAFSHVQTLFPNLVNILCFTSLNHNTFDCTLVPFWDISLVQNCF
ncbi:hypothetical protein C9374_001557 [Naegleria lovaniensis]|uniref:Uncharacterized protein n=1 Tax=Naegleria lovaniensis TaxID=51637 RepID=A0AA88GUM9_NAELO|nr:uncharacterized protein C9374_001557 [Naegleria lovaniensis]KAG2387225.1 hypothetical protein C9374_001557 [Naegleria lovaniensis]